MTTEIDLRYPTGAFDFAGKPDAEGLRGALEAIRELPDRLRGVLDGLNDGQLDTPYRPGGWTVRQLVHHLADSHVNAYCRMRLVLTEERPTVRAYDQDRWAELEDARSGPLEPSLELLAGLHARWHALLGRLRAEDFDRPLRHPEVGDLTLGRLVAYYGWHCRHHVAHIAALRERQGWPTPAA